MAKFKPQYRRLIFIDSKIREGGYPNCSTLAEEWEVTPKTIQRDINYLKWELDAPVEYDKVRHGYYYTEQSYRLPAISISESDLFAICIAEKALEQYKQTPVYEKLASVFERIQGSLPDEVSVHPSWVDARFSFLQEPTTRIEPEIWDAIAQAIRGNRQLKIRHHAPGDAGSSRERRVDPYHVINYRGQWYLIGHCQRSDKIRTFGISRVTSATVTEQAFHLPEEFSIQKLLGSHFGIMWGESEYHVRIKFNRRAAPYIMERRWHPSQKTKAYKDGSVLLDFTTNHLNEVKDWVLTWGGNAKVVSPKELLEKVKAEVVAAAALYEKEETSEQ